MRIKQLDIQKMPGFPTGLKTYEDMAEHINIIAGANGTGKSSTARVIQKLIWWDKKSRLNVQAELLINNLSHRVQIDYPDYFHTDPQQNKNEEDFRAYVSEGFEKQYILALHDLVKGEDENLAKEIIKEVNGGFDLKQAEDSLKYDKLIYKTNRSEYLNYQKAQKAYWEITREQESLKARALQLEKLKEEAKQAKEAKDRKKYLEDLIVWKNIQEEQIRNKERFTSFSPVLEHLRADDYPYIEQLESKGREQQEEISRLEQSIIEDESRISQLAIPEKGLEDTILDELDTYKEELREKKRLLEAAQIEIDRLAFAQKQATSTISLPEEPLEEPLTPEDLRTLESMTREANRIEGEYENLSDRTRQLQMEIAEQENRLKGHTDPEILNQGIAELSRWLKQEASSTSENTSFAWLSILLSVLTAVAVGFWGWIGLLGILILLAVAVYGNIRKEKKKEKGLTNSETCFLKLGLEAPSVWSSDEVTRTMDDLIRQQHQASYRETLKRQERELTALWTACKEKREATGRQYQDWINRLHLRTEIFEPAGERANAFYYFIRELIRWQEATVALLKEQVGLERLQTEFDDLLKRGNQYLNTWGRMPAETWEAFDAQVKELRKLSDKQKELLNSLQNNKALLAQIQRQYNEVQTSLTDIYKRLTLADGAKEEVKQLSVQLKEYEAIRKTFHETAAVLADRQRELEKSPFYSETSLKETSLEEALHACEQYGREAEGYEKLLEEITSIEWEIKQAQSGNTLEMAIEDRDESLKRLGDAFEWNMQSVTGELIVSQLRQEISLNNENRVFREANRILGDITQQRYGLLLSDVKESVFKAIDHRTEQVFTLEELSTGTRVQLLLSIRLAYIQSLEKNIKLPILADELLANSDDQRSEAIIRSLIEISRERQVFYFTAQGDEVGKWKSYLDKAEGIQHKIFTLGDTSGDTGFYRPEIQPVLLIDDVPKPSGSHAAYGQILQVPAFNLREDTIRNLHLWYLFTDNERIYPYLRRGISRWGQLEQLKEKGDSAGLTTAEWESLHLKVTLVEEFLSLYRQGRPKTIDRQVLEESNIMTTADLKKLTPLLNELNGNPLLFLDALPKVSNMRYREEKIEQFSAYLLEHNYIDGKEVLPAEELNLSLQAKISELGIDMEEAHRLVTLLTTVPIFNGQ